MATRNFVPRADDEGFIGKLAKRWKRGYFTEGVFYNDDGASGKRLFYDSAEGKWKYDNDGNTPTAIGSGGGGSAGTTKIDYIPEYANNLGKTLQTNNSFQRRFTATNQTNGDISIRSLIYAGGFLWAIVADNDNDAAQYYRKLHKINTADWTDEAVYDIEVDINSNDYEHGKQVFDGQNLWNLVQNMNTDTYYLYKFDVAAETYTAMINLSSNYTNYGVDDLYNHIAYEDSKIWILSHENGTATPNDSIIRAFNLNGTEANNYSFGQIHNAQYQGKIVSDGKHIIIPFERDFGIVDVAQFPANTKIVDVNTEFGISDGNLATVVVDSDFYYITYNNANGGTDTFMLRLMIQSIDEAAYIYDRSQNESSVWLNEYIHNGKYIIYSESSKFYIMGENVFYGDISALSVFMTSKMINLSVNAQMAGNLTMDDIFIYGVGSMGATDAYIRRVVLDGFIL